MRQQKINNQPRLNNFNLNFILTRNMNNTWPLVRISLYEKVISNKKLFLVFAQHDFNAQGFGKIIESYAKYLTSFSQQPLIFYIRPYKHRKCFLLVL